MCCFFCLVTLRTSFVKSLYMVSILFVETVLLVDTLWFPPEFFFKHSVFQEIESKLKMLLHRRNPSGINIFCGGKLTVDLGPALLRDTTQSGPCFLEMQCFH